jgi:KUP system potassium uptake protein
VRLSTRRFCAVGGEGLEVVSASLQTICDPDNLCWILLALFAVQNTAPAVSAVLNPSPCGFVHRLLLGDDRRQPDHLERLSPHYALQFMFTNPGVTFVILGAIVL